LWAAVALIIERSGLPTTARDSGTLPTPVLGRHLTVAIALIIFAVRTNNSFRPAFLVGSIGVALGVFALLSVPPAVRAQTTASRPSVDINDGLARGVIA